MNSRGGEPVLAIRAARSEEYPAVRAFYHELIDAMAKAAYHPGWKTDVYPAPEDLKKALERGQLYLGILEGEIAAAMVT